MRYLKMSKTVYFLVFVHLQSNGIYLLGLLILPQETSSADEAATVDHLQVTWLRPSLFQPQNLSAPHLNHTIFNSAIYSDEETCCVGNLPLYQLVRCQTFLLHSTVFS